MPDCPVLTISRKGTKILPPTLRHSLENVNLLVENCPTLFLIPSVLVFYEQKMLCKGTLRHAPLLLFQTGSPRRAV